MTTVQFADISPELGSRMISNNSETVKGLGQSPGGAVGMGRKPRRAGCDALIEPWRGGT